jgi:hypothetical protein
MATRSRARRNSSNNEVLGYIVWNARFYGLVAVPIICIWLTINGFLSVKVAWFIGVVSTLAMTWVLSAIVKALVNGPVNRSGCGIALMAFWISIIPLAIFYWQGGFDFFVVGLIFMPLIVVGIGIIISRMNPSRDKSWPSR